MTSFVLRAYLKLIYFDLFLGRGDFPALYQKVRHYPIADIEKHSNTRAEICDAVDIACVWYWKEALCLQRSATTVCLLRQHGVAAQLIIGVQQLPFRAHAWVEVDNRVINDKPYMREMYAVLDQC